MAFIRDNSEERTGIQIRALPDERTDFSCDFVMAYGLDETTGERIKLYKSMGYVVHFMTGISWGSYTDYLDGIYDGADHWDEVQTDRNGNRIMHSVRVPYMVPTISFADYLSNKFRVIVDSGAEAIHVEEPEFWDRAGYSPAFKREYELYYREPWKPQHESADGKYKCSKLKAYLFTRTIDRVASSIKEYAKRKYNKNIRFYVPTHSLINYTQWKIVSPEGKLSDIPAVDGCIAQVWTGTSREENWFDGVRKERTFETAYLEYGVMQELVKGTGRKMWFLHDPIEDNPIFDWTDYRKNYLATVTASLLHPGINSFEVAPWPNRVFNEKRPKDSPDAEYIPEDYKTLLYNVFNTLGTFECEESKGLRVGILTGDSELYQRAYPDCCFSVPPEEKTGTVIREEQSLFDEFTEKLFKGNDEKGEIMLKYMASNGFPGFFSLALPLLKYGIPVRPVLTDNTRRFPGYLDDYDVLVMSYEFMKPDYPDINTSIAEWVRRGGTLYIADSCEDVFNSVNSWWTGKYKAPLEHLFDMLGIPFAECSAQKCGKGFVTFTKTNPCIYSFSKANADIFRKAFKSTVEKAGYDIEYKNYLKINRGERIAASVMDESFSTEPLTLTGLFADMFALDFSITEKKVLNPGEHALLTDLNKIKEDTAIIGTSVRIRSMECNGKKAVLNVQGAGHFDAYMRIKLPFVPGEAYIDGEKCDMQYDAKSKTVLLHFINVLGLRTVTVY